MPWSVELQSEPGSLAFSKQVYTSLTQKGKTNYNIHQKVYILEGTRDDWFVMEGTRDDWFVMTLEGTRDDWFVLEETRDDWFVMTGCLNPKP